MQYTSHYSTRSTEGTETQKTSGQYASVKTDQSHARKNQKRTFGRESSISILLNISNLDIIAIKNLAHDFLFIVKIYK